MCIFKTFLKPCKISPKSFLLWTFAGEDISCEKTCIGCIYHLLTHARDTYRPVSDLSRSAAVKLTNRLLCFWTDRGFVDCKRVHSLPFLVSYQSLTVTSLFANTLAGTRTQRILRAKADFKQSTCVKSYNMCNWFFSFPHSHQVKVT